VLGGLAALTSTPQITRIEFERAVLKSSQSGPNSSTQNVYTKRVDDRPIVWDDANRKHLGEDHPERQVTLEEIDQVLGDARRIESVLPGREAYQVVGRTSAGRWLVVIWIDQPTGRYPIHARAASKRIIRRVSK
jgi:hypothetical protein